MCLGYNCVQHGVICNVNDAFTWELCSRSDGGFYKPQRLKAESKVMLDMLIELLFTDDYALCASSEREMQLARRRAVMISS